MLAQVPVKKSVSTFTCVICEVFTPGIESDAVATALRRGRMLHDLEHSAEAPHVDEEAPASTGDELATLKASCPIHRIGGCALDFEDGPLPLTSYVGAGRRAKDVGMRRLCGKSLAAAGWSLATHPVATPIADIVDRDLVATGYDGVIEEAREALLVDGKPSFGHVMILHARFAGLMILSAEAFLDEASSLAAEHLRHDVLNPFLALHDVVARTTADESVVEAYKMMALLRLCRALGEQGRQRRMGVPVTRDAVAEMAGHVANAFVRETAEPMQLWLGSYLRRHRGADRTMDDHLRMTASGR